ncbi:MAG: LysR family transcriptional regulator [Pseudomonadota bacterium]
MDELSLLCKVVDAGSFAATAEQLALSPSAVSKRISRMEARLGVRLFNRTTRSLALTEAGQTLYKQGQNLLESIAGLEAQVRDLAVEASGNLRVACSDAFAVRVVVPMMAEFSVRYPRVQITLLQGDGPLDLLAAEVDLAIRFEPPTHANFVHKRLIADPWVVCATPRYLAEHGTPEHPQDLLTHRCLAIHARGQTSNHWQFQADGHTADMMLQPEFAGIGMVVKAAVLQDMGIARLANFLVRDDVQAGRLVPLLQRYLQGQQRGIYAVFPHREYVPLKVRVFIDMLTTHLRSQS